MSSDSEQRQPKLPEALDSAQGSGSSPGRVLVVDDDPATRMLVRRWLETSGFEVREAVRGDEAVEAVASDPGLGLVVLDAMMPDLDGFGVLERIKRDPATANIPVLMLTAHATREDEVVRAFDLGAVDHVAKPFSGPVLIARVRTLLAKRRAEIDARAALANAERQALTDPLTGLANRRALELALRRESSYTGRHGEPLAFMILDIDRFKSINDRFGHPAGDRVLVHFATMMREALRASDHTYRIGGEEFAMLLRRSTAEQATAVAQRLRVLLRSSPFPLEGGESVVIAFSAGIASAEERNAYATDSLLARADEALYRAKHGGRDRVEIESALRET